MGGTAKVLTVGPGLEANRREVLHDLTSAAWPPTPGLISWSPPVSPRFCAFAHTLPSMGHLSLPSQDS